VRRDRSDIGALEAAATKEHAMVPSTTGCLLSTSGPPRASDSVAAAALDPSGMFVLVFFLASNNGAETLRGRPYFTGAEMSFYTCLGLRAQI
jgi:hypothetical protein